MSVSAKGVPMSVYEVGPSIVAQSSQLVVSVKPLEPIHHKKLAQQLAQPGQHTKQASTYPFFCPQCGNRRVEDIKFCVKCGLLWERISDASTILAQKLGGLSDADLIVVLKNLYPCMDRVVKETAEKGEWSVSHVFRVLVGERKSKDVDKELVKVFRRRLKSNAVANVL